MEISTRYHSGTITLTSPAARITNVIAGITQAAYDDSLSHSPARETTQNDGRFSTQAVYITRSGLSRSP